MKICATGHRPNKLGGYGNTGKVDAFAISILKRMVTWYNQIHVISGMALGWDQSIAKACVELAIPFDAYVPFWGQSDKWPAESQQVYDKLLEKAQKVRVISMHYTPSAMQDRNVAMVKDSEAVLALYNGTRGGTQNCVHYAYATAKTVFNVWKEFVQFKP